MAEREICLSIDQLLVARMRLVCKCKKTTCIMALQSITPEIKCPACKKEAVNQSLSELKDALDDTKACEKENRSTEQYDSPFVYFEVSVDVNLGLISQFK